MKALVYHGPKKVSVDTVPDAKIEKLTDVVIELTTTNICSTTRYAATRAFKSCCTASD